MREWDWKEHFSPQPDTLAYLNYVAFEARTKANQQPSLAVGARPSVAFVW